MGVELLGGLAFLDALVRIAIVALARGVHKTGIYDAAFAGDDASAFERQGSRFPFFNALPGDLRFPEAPLCLKSASSCAVCACVAV